MNVHEFSVAVAKHEGLKKQLSIAQIKEVLRVANDLTDGWVYKLVWPRIVAGAPKGKRRR